MRGVRRVGLFGVVVALWVLAGAGAAPGQDTEPRLEGPRGPYRGRVVELLTDRPLPGALVVMVWEMTIEEGGEPGPFAFREMLTEADGEFAVDALAIESSPPPRALWPRIVVYKPGYAAYPRQLIGLRPGAPAARFTGKGSVVELRPLTKQDDRIEAFNAFFAHVNRIWRLDGMPESFRLVRAEIEYFKATLKEEEK